MMTRRFRLVAVYLGAFSLGAATAAGQAATRAARATTIVAATRAAGATTIAALTAASNSSTPATNAVTSHIDAPVPLSTGQMRETVGAGWWQALVTIVSGVVETVALVWVSENP